MGAANMSLRENSIPTYRAWPYLRRLLIAAFGHRIIGGKRCVSVGLAICRISSNLESVEEGFLLPKWKRAASGIGENLTVLQRPLFLNGIDGLHKWKLILFLENLIGRENAKSDYR